MKNIWKTFFADPKNTSEMSRILLLVGVLAAGVIFAECSAGISQFLRAPLWFSSALVNSGLAGWVVFYGPAREVVPNVLHTASLMRWLRDQPWIAYLPGLMVLLGAWGWMRGALSMPIAISNMQLATLLWVPVVEEWVFRKGVGPWLRRYSGSLFWGSYLSILLFSFLHVSPTLAHLLEWKIGFPLGPLLLGAACEFLYVSTGKLGPCIVLHAICNGVVIAGFSS